MVRIHARQVTQYQALTRVNGAPNHLRRRLRQDALLVLTGAFRTDDIVGWRRK
jgi:hypothetical protein